MGTRAQAPAVAADRDAAGRHPEKARAAHSNRGGALKGDDGHQIRDGWAAFTYNADTYTTLPLSNWRRARTSTTRTPSLLLRC